MRILRGGIFLVVAAIAFAQSPDDEHRFTVSSTTFANDTVMPLSTIHNNVVNGVNTCTANGAPGGNQSPELFWKGAPPGTQTFAVVLYDTTAAFTHWGIYNIPGTATGLPENAGVSGSKYGPQILNDFGIGNEYDGPCPPANVAPDTHHYVFTVYALDVSLKLPSSANFPANAETLYHALLRAGREHHILASASITGLYSSTPSK
ncbi:MAG TPA: YbhB/YbcL family Raf kinase inhibitor-like protein [Bryobacteraceae bacterium]|nr:YbhB/YbcL family Raf kinase inhibitor-like protein [Bryobacteraceae bacterium]